MRRREFITLVGGTAIAASLPVRAQQTSRTRRVGVLIPYSRNDKDSQIQYSAFISALQQLGWINGQNLEIDALWSNDDTSSIAQLAKELVAREPAAILARATPVTAALRKETHTIPIVFVVVSDPVGDGLVDSMARPGSNVTGFTNAEASLGGKWLQLLKNLAPNTKRVAVVFGRATSPGGGNYYLRLIEGAAEPFSVSVIAAPVQGADDVQQAVASLTVGSDTGLIITPDATTTRQRKLIIDAVAAHRIPAIYPYRFMSEEGGLASYGVDVTDLYRRAAGYVDRILRGENPSELPVQAPTKFEFVINLTTAKTLGLTIPASLMSLADELIE
jgi:putative ABC transport system substrate-binding protein